MRITGGCLALVTFLWTVVSRGDKDVWCRLNESCLLQANFTVGQDVVIHWQKKLKEDIYAHSYYYSADQLQLQDKQFKNRTSLFKEHIKDGNSTLLLKKVVVADEGRYMCYVGTISEKKESFINLHVEAAVTTINIQQDGNNLTCSSSGIYPEPQLTWSTEPLLPHALQNATKVDNGTGETLYSISGWLVVAGDNTSQVDYICDVRSHSSRRLTWKNGSTVRVSGSETVINCPFLTGEKSVVWMFNNRTIVKMNNGAKDISEEWKEQVKDVSTSGNLGLHSLSSDHEGTYTCQVDNATETRVITFFLSTAGVSPSRLGRTSHWWILAVVLLVLVVGLVAGFAYWKHKRSASNRPRSNPEEVIELNSVKDGGESQTSENERCLAGNNNGQADLS